MAKVQWIARQSAHPTGWLGHIVARAMSIETGAVNRQVLRALEPKPGERICELGSGHGRALRAVARAVSPGGEAVGVDPSAVMRSVATRRLRGDIAAGRARIEAGDSGSIPEPDESFDKLFSVHTLYFWPDLATAFDEFHRVLRPGGTLLVAFHSSENARVAAKLPDNIYTLRTGSAVAEVARRSGFSDVIVNVDPTTEIRFLRSNA